jgi:integrase
VEQRDPLRRGDLGPGVIHSGSPSCPVHTSRSPSPRRRAGPPKSTAGVRVVALPAMIVDVMRAHLVDFPAESEELLFGGRWVRHCGETTFHRSVHWSKIVVEAGLPAGFHFHDLRHTGNNLAPPAVRALESSCPEWATATCAPL